MHSGNVQKTPDGQIYLLDFDTSCEGTEIILRTFMPVDIIKFDIIGRVPEVEQQIA